MIYRVYRVTNLINDKSYVGITRRPLSKRLAQHRSKALTSKVRLLHRAMVKYGRENFSIEELCICPNRKTVATVERQLIKQLGTRAPKGYNLTTGGDVGTRHSPETKEKLRLIALARKSISRKTRRKMGESQKGRKHSAVTKAKMSAWHKGKKVSKATRKKISKVMSAYWERYRQARRDYIQRLQSRRVASSVS